MTTSFDRLARQLGQNASRRQAALGLGALALGSLGLASLSQVEAEKNCKQKCKDKNCGSLTPSKCSKRCKQRCRGKNND